MLKIFICDDDERYLATITSEVEKYASMSNFAMEIVCTATSPTPILEYLEKNTSVVGLYFLDLHLEADINGIELAMQIRKHDPRGFIAFITSDAKSSKHTFKYKIEALDYIEKDDVEKNERIRACLDSAVEKLTVKATPVQDNFIFKISEDIKKTTSTGTSIGAGSTVVIDKSKIICFTTDPDIKRTVVVYTTEGRKVFSGHLNKVEQDISDKRFYRCQNNLLINMDKVTGFDPVQRLLTMEHDMDVTIVARQVKKLNAQILSYSNSTGKPSS